MRQTWGFAQAFGLGLGLALGAALFLPTGTASGAPTPQEKFATKLDKYVAKAVKQALKKGVIEGGVATAVVVDTDDPQGKSRVKVRFAWGAGNGESEYWADPVVTSVGVMELPEVEDEVLVAFVHGDIRHPYVLGRINLPPLNRR